MKGEGSHLAKRKFLNRKILPFVFMFGLALLFFVFLPFDSFVEKRAYARFLSSQGEAGPKAKPSSQGEAGPKAKPSSQGEAVPKAKPSSQGEAGPKAKPSSQGEAPSKPKLPLPLKKKWTVHTINKTKKSAADLKQQKLYALYKNYRSAWHAVTDSQKPAPLVNGIPKLVLYAINTLERVELTAQRTSGGFSAEDLEKASILLRDPRTGNRHPVEPRTLDAVYQLQVHFSAPEIRVISGYRTPKPNTHSNHGKGRAIDLVVPKTTDEQVARFARTMGFKGVGIYPISGFVHIDVRQRSYFWVDSSFPGKKNRERGIYGDLAHESDQLAKARGEKPVPPYEVVAMSQSGWIEPDAQHVNPSSNVGDGADEDEDEVDSEGEGEAEGAAEAEDEGENKGSSPPQNQAGVERSDQTKTQSEETKALQNQGGSKK